MDWANKSFTEQDVTVYSGSNCMQNPMFTFDKKLLTELASQITRPSQVFNPDQEQKFNENIDVFLGNPV